MKLIVSNRRVYTFVRLAAYACGLLGAALMAAGRREMFGGSSAAAQGAGAALLIAMFLLFVVSYVLALAGRAR